MSLFKIKRVHAYCVPNPVPRPPNRTDTSAAAQGLYSTPESDFNQMISQSNYNFAFPEALTKFNLQ